MEKKTTDNSTTGGAATMKGGTLVISLDFELHWGGSEKWTLNDSKKQYFENTRKCIPTLLTLFESSGISVTWATVGFLFFKEKKELLANLPEVEPTYNDSSISAYNYLKNNWVGDTEEEDPFHFAHSLLDLVKASRGQEISTHSFSHYYCNEDGQTAEQFYSDLKAADGAAQKFDVIPKSLVFPRNQYNAEYLKACKRAGIEIVRVNPLDWWWQIDSTQSESKWKRLNRGADAYFSIGGKTSFSLSQIKKEEGVWLLPASRLLRPYNPKELFLNDLKIKKIKKEMTLAAKNNEVYHLWWHPHNFGNYTQENINGLVEIVNHYQFLHKEYGMNSKSMGEMATILNNQHG
ncbi:polysaccharide deacetylase family protein [Fulvivirga maritima]|uniref:polysaccharide deacetylase family protein n=1 Tax=Fulvivirga maritima TaxID=2904247 RepID=UPI001F1EB1BB|nr:polysaccharide deacetylase family protein [Fulvivirga maritima]UII24848.1 polysaccharide deacetylase family protein [Fulvivirga maritima]